MVDKRKENELYIWFQQGEERDWLLSIKHSDFPSEQAVKKTYSILEEIESKRPWNSLPGNFDPKFMEKIMMECYENDFLTDKSIPSDFTQM
jgi:hypothetical protein